MNPPRRKPWNEEEESVGPDLTPTGPMDIPPFLLDYLRRLEKKIDSLIAARGGEEREHGAIEQRIKELEEFKASCQRILAGVIVTSSLAMAGTLLMWIVRMIGMHSATVLK